MSAGLTFSFWLKLIGGLGLEGLVIVAVAYCGQRRVASAPSEWPRAVWRTAFLGLLLIALCELTGQGARWAMAVEMGAHHVQAAKAKPLMTADRGEAPGQGTPQQATSPTPQMAPSTKVPSSVPPHVSSESVPVFTSHRPSVGDGVKVPISVHWPGWVWLAGSLVLALRLMVSKGFLWLGDERHAETDGDVVELVHQLALRMGVRRPVKVRYFSRLHCPVAYGLWRPTVGLPRDFDSRYGVQQKTVLLAHELGHLRAHDARWHLLAEVILAVWWWHPLVWWARRRLWHATEMAADEASRLVEHGPGILAECLVEVGRRYRRSAALTWVGAEGSGFGSSLGRRVERLLRMDSNPTASRMGYASRAGLSVGVAGVCGLAILGTKMLAQGVGSLPRSGDPSEASYWRTSLARITFAAVFNSGEAGIPSSSTLPDANSARAGSLGQTPAGENGGGPSQVEADNLTNVAPASRTNELTSRIFVIDPFALLQALANDSTLVPKTGGFNEKAGEWALGVPSAGLVRRFLEQKTGVHFGARSESRQPSVGGRAPGLAETAANLLTDPLTPRPTTQDGITRVLYFRYSTSLLYVRATEKELDRVGKALRQASRTRTKLPRIQLTYFGNYATNAPVSANGSSGGQSSQLASKVLRVNSEILLRAVEEKMGVDFVGPRFEDIDPTPLHDEEIELLDYCVNSGAYIDTPYHAPSLHSSIRYGGGGFGGTIKLDQNLHYREVLRAYFTTATGIPFDSTYKAAADPDNFAQAGQRPLRTLFFSLRQGAIYVRATPAELKLVEKAIADLNATAREKPGP